MVSNTIDLDLECEEIVSSVSGYYKRLNARLEGVNMSQLDCIEIAKCIDPYTFIEAYGENELKEFIKTNFDWFNTEY